MKRVISLWFPYWASERLARRRRNSPAPAEPLVLVEAGRGGLRVAAASPAAGGVAPGMTLADARALLPGLAVARADPHGDARALAALAGWCIRFTPFVALDGADGLILDVTGCARLFGGEAALVARVARDVRRLGFTARAALADTPGAAWAAARFLPEAGSERGALAPPGGAEAMLSPLPVAALRLTPDAAFALDRLGLRRVGDLLHLPRAPLAARFGAAVGRRLDQALGREAEAITPHRPAPPYLVRRVFTEPLIDHAGVADAVAGLLAELCARLEAEGRGLSRLELSLFRVDGARRPVTIGAARPTRDAAHLMRLIAVHLDGLDLGFGVEAMALAAPGSEPLAAAQVPLMPGERDQAGGLAALVDRLANRLGATGVVRLVPRASHVPERAVAAVPAMAPPVKRPWRAEVKRPVRLFPRPERIEVVAMVPDAPPVLFRWRGRARRVARAEGPERLAAEWWRECDARDFRDYYRVEDEDGGRYWLYRHGPFDARGAARWYLHGIFA